MLVLVKRVVSLHYTTMVIKEPFERQQPRYFDDFIVKEGNLFLEKRNLHFRKLLNTSSYDKDSKMSYSHTSTPTASNKPQIAGFKLLISISTSYFYGHFRSSNEKEKGVY